MDRRTNRQTDKPENRKVTIRPAGGSPVWIEATILDQTGPVSFRVRLSDGRVRKRHVDHLRIRYPEESSVPVESETWQGPMSIPSPSSRATSGLLDRDPGELSGGQTQHAQTLRRSGRARNPPDRLQNICCQIQSQVVLP